MLLISRCNQTFGGFALGKAFQFLLEFLEIPFSNHIFANASRIADMKNIGVLEWTIKQGPGATMQHPIIKNGTPAFSFGKVPNTLGCLFSKWPSGEIVVPINVSSWTCSFISKVRVSGNHAACRPISMVRNILERNKCRPRTERKAIGQPTNSHAHLQMLTELNVVELAKT